MLPSPTFFERLMLDAGFPSSSCILKVRSPDPDLALGGTATALVTVDK